MARAARKVVALVDSSKVGEEHLEQIIPCSMLDLLVTDKPLLTTLANQLAQTGMEVLVA